jgi:peroxiredoxin
MTVKVGDTAPDFTLPSQTGTSVSLKDFKGKKNVIVYFYPKDNSPGCTTQACAFRDSYEVFKDAGAEVIGISEDSPRIAPGICHQISTTIYTAERYWQQSAAIIRSSSYTLDYAG